MNEAVDRVIEQREALDRGFPAGVVMSSAAHVLAIGLAIGSAWFASKPRLQVSPLGIAVPLPPGGGGPLAPEPAPAAGPPVTAAPQAPPPAPAPEPPPKVIKPPKEEPKKGLPMPDAKKSRTRPTPTPPPSRSAASVDPRARGSAGAPGSTGANSATPGLGIVGPVGPGVPYGTDPLGDWYLAGVQRKVWTIWMRQVKSNFTQQIVVTFTILADGSLEDGSVRPVQSSGVQLLDLAAQRAVISAAPFAPLPKTYATNRITIQALFQPIP